MSGNDDSQFAAERMLLTAQFKAAVQTVIETIDANPNLNPVVDDTDSILRLLYLLERIFSHGLKQMNFFGATSMWHVFAQLPTCLPGTDKFVEQVKDWASTSDIARGRVALRAALNEGSLVPYINALCTAIGNANRHHQREVLTAASKDFNQALLAKCYHKSALLRSEEHVNIVVMLLQALAQAVQFHLPVRDANFADEKYWSKHGAATVEQQTAAQSDFPAAQVATNDAMELRRSITEQKRLREQKQAERAAKDLADRQASLALAEEQAARTLREREQELAAREQRLTAELSLASQLRESLQQQQEQQKQLFQQQADAATASTTTTAHDESAETQRLFQVASAAYNSRAPSASVFVDASGTSQGVVPRVATASARGRRAKMEDAIAVLKAPLTLALFDGHGGPDAALMCASGLSTFLRASLVGRANDIPAVLRLTCARLQSWLAAQQSPPMAELGTTATVVMQSDGAWHVAQVGDARAVLFEFAFAAVERSTWSGVTAATSPSLDDLRASNARARAELARAADFNAEPRNIGVGGALVRAQELAPCHRPSVESERTRIEERGGAILRNRVCGVLAVTRALGDTALDPYLSHTPELRGPFNWDAAATSGGGEFEYRSALVIGCDGAWDVLSIEAVAQQVIAATLGESDGGVDVSKSDVESSLVLGAADAAAIGRPSDARTVQVRPVAAAERIRDAALRNGSADNVSVVVAALPVVVAAAAANKTNPALVDDPPVIVPHVISAPVAVVKPRDADSIVRQTSSGVQQLSPPSPSSSSSSSSMTSEMSKRERRLLAAEAARHRARQQSTEGSDGVGSVASADSTPETQRRRSRAATSSDALRSSNSTDERRATLDDLDLTRRELAAEREAERQRIVAERAKQRRRAADVRRIVANYAAQKEARQSAEATALAEKEHARRRRAAATFGAEWDAKSVPSAAPSVPDEPLVLSLSADENAIVAYLRDPLTGIGAQRVQRGEERVFTGSELVDWLLQHIDATPPVTPPQTPPRFGSGLLPLLDDNDAPSSGAMGGIAGVRRSDAFAFAQRLVAIGVVRILHDAALASPSSSSSSTTSTSPPTPARNGTVPVGELRDSLTVTLALNDDFSATIVLRENPATELVDSGNGVVMAFPTRAPRRRPDWLDDKCTNACMQCQAVFRLTLRRHHCRSCGFIVCGKCAKRKIALPHLGYASRQLCCERCIATFYSSSAKIVVNGVMAVAPAAEGGRRSRRNTSEVTVAAAGAATTEVLPTVPASHGSIESLPVSYGVSGGLQDLIPVINKLQDIFTVTGGAVVGSKADASTSSTSKSSALLSSAASTALVLELPQIVVVGSQSSGKSSVLEALVGRDFLPRGSGIVTRRPLVLQLFRLESAEKNAAASSTGGAKSTQEWGEFLHKPGVRFTDFSEIRREIERETDRLTGTNKGVSSTPINLKVYSTEVINLTLVDLPGITRVPIGDQPPDIEVQIRNMVLDFIRPHNAVILAVTAGNSDLSNSDALKLARDVDPAGERTLGVITKLDIMDAGTNALSVLTGQVIPLKLGYIGVVNRSQKDIIDNKAVRAALSDEKTYFETHPVYKSIAARCGIPHLARTLQKLLLQHINAFLPTLRARLLDMRTDAARELELCGPELTDDNESSRQVRLLDILTRVADAYKSGLDISDDVDVTELQAGARVNFIFNDVFGTHVAAMDPLQGISDNDIKTCLHNAAGTRPALFIAEAAFELLVRRQIELLRDPAMQCIDLVHEELRRVVGGLDVNALKQFDALRERVFSVFKAHLQLCAERSKAVIGNVVDCELAFININHPDFVGADEVTSRMLKKSLRNKAAANKEGGDGDAAAAAAAPAFAAKKATSKKDEPPQLRRVPGQIRAGSYQTEKEKFEIDVIKTLLVSYFDIVRKRLRDLVPKSAMLFLVQKSQKDMHNVLVRDVYGDVKQTAAFLAEPEHVTARRNDMKALMALLNDALKVLSTLSGTSGASSHFH